MSVIVGNTASGIFDGSLNLIGKSTGALVYIPSLDTITLDQLDAVTGTFSYIYDGSLNICGVNVQAGSKPGVYLLGLVTTPIGPTGSYGTASINIIVDGGINTFGSFDSVNYIVSIPGLTSSSNF